MKTQIADMNFRYTPVILITVSGSLPNFESNWQP